MKKINNRNKTNLFKKIFIKICRIFGFEIIDQSNFSSPTLRKNLDDALSTQGKKSITIPLGQIDIKKKVRSLKIIVRTCTSELIMDQNKRRIFDCEKNEYTFRNPTRIGSTWVSQPTAPLFLHDKNRGRVTRE